MQLKDILLLNGEKFHHITIKSIINKDMLRVIVNLIGNKESLSLYYIPEI